MSSGLWCGLPNSREPQVGQKARFRIWPLPPASAEIRHLACYFQRVPRHYTSGDTGTASCPLAIATMAVEGHDCFGGALISNGAARTAAGEVARSEGFEPPTPRFEVMCSGFFQVPDFSAKCLNPRVISLFFHEFP